MDNIINLVTQGLLTQLPSLFSSEEIIDLLEEMICPMSSSQVPLVPILDDSILQVSLILKLII